ncbi:MAG: glyoxylate/hydroxypyruvate reductase A [Leeuwenhoekiella sp.]
MALLLLRNDNRYDRWLDALKEVDPEMQVFTPETLEDRNKITMALSWKAPKGSYDNLPNLKAIGSMGAGADHLFEDPSLPEDVVLTRLVDDKLAGDMQEYVLTVCLSHIKHLDYYRDLQEANTWKPKRYKRTENVQVGILGLGTLGQAVGKKLHNNGFKVSGYSHSRKEIEGITSCADGEMDEFLKDVDILVCLLPLTENTRGILNVELFEKLPDGAYLVNVARGPHLVDDDLIKFLDSEKLSGATLDVFHQEPLPKDHPFWNHPKIKITPHVASMSSPSSVAPQIVDNYHRLEKGEELRNQVSREREY